MIRLPQRPLVGAAVGAAGRRSRLVVFVVFGCLAIAGCGGSGTVSSSGAGGGSPGSARSGSAGAGSGSAGAGSGSGSAGTASSGSGGAGVGSGAGASASGRAAADASVSISAQGVGNAIPTGFLGLSLEFQAVRAYEGRNAARIDPVFVQLIRNLSPGQAPVLRIGGDSTDVSYVPARGVQPPAFASYRLTPGWLAATAKLAHVLGARMILGINLAANDPTLSAAEAKAFMHAFGAGSIEAFEVGNEPNVYSKLAIWRTVFGLPVPARPKGFAYPAFRRQFQAVATATAAKAPGPLLAGPALAAGPTAGRGSWVRVLPNLVTRLPQLAIMTVHRYPLRNCFVPPSSPQYPTISHLLASFSTRGLAASLKPWLAIARSHHRSLRVDELNSVACRGKAGVSDTFASALWMTDALFSLARAGVNGVNVHTLPNSAYQLFVLSHTGGLWQARVAPVYYGMQLFEQAAPPGARLLRINRSGLPAALSVWATRATDSTVRVVLINKDPATARIITLTLPPGTGTRATIERMRAPSVASRGGVTLGGRTYGARTTTGVLGAPTVAPSPVAGGRIRVSLPAGSAALVTVAP